MSLTGFPVWARPRPSWSRSFHANQCWDPFTPQSRPYQIGDYVSYAVNIPSAADVQVLEYMVVTANGQLVSASPSRNNDLYCAHSGGGPGTFGVVVCTLT
ncbi:26dd166a-998e-4e77-9a8b-b26018a81de1 [Thermothielavioides terrestris]|uniref:26dd166a-998e-4e77-9a8b-b26018a81de1 n=1 Tax=Thermothielavioides terrestris TaxID=2587410 RepID=A0A446BR91_9PEZI|nr:26dd166a-998e-4e77-9a8b-b26018a81de1 [Thermothielavioides terrestris]